MAFKKLRRKGFSQIMWTVVVALPILVIMLGFTAWFGVLVFSVHTDMFGLQNEILFERAVQNLYDTDPITNNYAVISNFAENPPSDVFVSGKQVHLRVVTSNATFYSDEELFTRMDERAPVAFDRHTKVKTINGYVVELTMVVDR